MTWGAEQTGPTEESEQVISTVYIVLTKKLRRTRLSNRLVASTSCPQNHMFFVENFFSCGHFGSSQNQNWRSKNNICSLLLSSPTVNVVLPLMVIGPVAAEQGIRWERLQRHSCIAIQKVLKQRYNFQNVSDFNDEKDTSLTRLQQLWQVWSLVLCPDQSESETLSIGNVWSFASGFFLYLTPVFFFLNIERNSISALSSYMRHRLTPGVKDILMWYTACRPFFFLFWDVLIPYISERFSLVALLNGQIIQF